MNLKRSTHLNTAAVISGSTPTISRRTFSLCTPSSSSESTSRFDTHWRRTLALLDNARYLSDADARTGTAEVAEIDGVEVLAVLRGGSLGVSDMNILFNLVLRSSS